MTRLVKYCWDKKGGCYILLQQKLSYFQTMERKRREWNKRCRACSSNFSTQNDIKWLPYIKKIIFMSKQMFEYEQHQMAKTLQQCGVVVGELSGVRSGFWSASTLFIEYNTVRKALQKTSFRKNFSWQKYFLCIFCPNFLNNNLLSEDYLYTKLFKAFWCFCIISSLKKVGPLKILFIIHWYSLKHKK